MFKQSRRLGVRRREGVFELYVGVMQDLEQTIRRAYPASIGALVFGSQINGTANAYSDTDVLVILKESEKSVSEPVFHNGFLLDVQALTLNTLTERINQHAVQRACFYLHVITQGKVLFDTADLFEKMQRQALRVLNNPPPLTGEQLKRKRGGFETKIRDLRRRQSKFALLGIVAEVHHLTLVFFSLNNTGWMASVDIMRDWLDKSSSQLRQELDAAYISALQGDIEPLERIAFQALEGMGGKVQPRILVE